MAEYDLVTVNNLKTLPLAISRFIAHCGSNGELGKATLSDLALFIAPYVSSVTPSSYRGVVTPASTPITGGVGFYFGSTGTYPNFGGVVITEELGIISQNGTTFTSLDIPIDLTQIQKDISTSNATLLVDGTVIVDYTTKKLSVSNAYTYRHNSGLMCGLWAGTGYSATYPKITGLSFDTNSFGSLQGVYYIDIVVDVTTNAEVKFSDAVNPPAVAAGLTRVVLGNSVWYNAIPESDKSFYIKGITEKLNNNTPIENELAVTNSSFFVDGTILIDYDARQLTLTNAFFFRYKSGLKCDLWAGTGYSTTFPKIQALSFNTEPFASKNGIYYFDVIPNTTVLAELKFADSTSLPALAPQYIRIFMGTSAWYNASPVQDRNFYIKALSEKLVQQEIDNISPVSFDNTTTLENQNKVFGTSYIAQAVKSLSVAGTYNGMKYIEPDAIGSYNAFWTRDAAYVLGDRKDMFSNNVVLDNYSFLKSKVGTVSGQPNYYWVPDHVGNNGTVYWTPGNTNDWASRATLDGNTFLVDIAYTYFKRTNSAAFITAELSFLVALIENLPYGSTGLITVTLGQAAGYGFQDTVNSTGALLYMSCLVYEAWLHILEMAEYVGNTTVITNAQGKLANLKTEIIAKFYVDDFSLNDAAGKYQTLGWMRAATLLNKDQFDVWGACLAIYLGITSEQQSLAIVKNLILKQSEWLQDGGVSHVPTSYYYSPTQVWESYFGGPGVVGTYQSGGFWITPLVHVLYAINLYDKQLARKILNDATNTFFERNFTEWWNGLATRGIDYYSASFSRLTKAVESINI